MAFPAETLAAEAAAVAEWLASDFFTIDGGTQIAADLESALPEGSSLPAAPSGSRSFVEWARAVSVEESGPGRYDVLVVVRRLGAADGENYRADPTGRARDHSLLDGTGMVGNRSAGPGRGPSPRSGARLATDRGPGGGDCSGCRQHGWESSRGDESGRGLASGGSDRRPDRSCHGRW